LNIIKAQQHEFCQAENKDCVSGADLVPEARSVCFSFLFLTWDDGLSIKEIV
jgi:hypothetical protein